MIDGLTQKAPLNGCITKQCTIPTIAAIQYRSAKLLVGELCPRLCLAINSHQHIVYIFCCCCCYYPEPLSSPTHPLSLPLQHISLPAALRSINDSHLRAANNQLAFILLPTIMNNCAYE